MPSLPADALDRIFAKIERFEPDAQAVLLRGSYATGAATGESDLDLTVITAGTPREPYRTWFEERRDDLLPVSISAKETIAWLARRRQPAEWALGFPAADVAAYVWATAAARAALGENPSVERPPLPPSLADFVDTAVKVRRARARADELAVRLYARETALLAPALLRALNDNVVVTDGREAMEAALGLAVAPEHYRNDFRTAAGLQPAGAEVVSSAVMRLAAELLAFLRERSPTVDPQPEIERYLRDGTFERYLAGRA